MMAVKQYDPLLSPLKKSGLIEDFEFVAAGGFASEVTERHFVVKVNYKADLASVEKAIAEATAGHPYNVRIAREIDLSASYINEDSATIKTCSNAGAEFLAAYMAGITPCPLVQYFEPRDLKQRTWKLPALKDVEYVEIMLDEAKNIGLNVKSL